MLAFDIETGPLADDQIAPFCPEFKAPPPPGEFDPAGVKIGNLKDQAKIEEKIQQAREAHNAQAQGYDELVAKLKVTHLAEFASKAALDAVTGRVLAIGYHSTESGKSAVDHCSGDEEKLIGRFWQQYERIRGKGKLVGANIFGFDLPFLIRRSWILGIDVPSSVRVNGRYFDPSFVDVREVWLCGQRWGDCQSSLDRIDRALGGSGKPADVNGGDFARLWCGTEEDRKQAIAYLLNDLEMTVRTAMRLGIV